jgi:hypothetical protein
MGSKKIKLAVIRDKKIKPCPFGLPVIGACKYAGDAVHRMAPLDATDDEEKKERLKKANTLVYIHHKTGNKCPFADKILEDHGKVDCDFGDTGQGQPHVPYRGSPLYPQTFTGIGLDGLYGYPLGFYADNNESRNLFFGLFSFLGSEKPKELIKLADKYDESGDNERADIIDEILETIESVRDSEELEEKMLDIESFLDKHRQEYEKGRTDTGLLFELAERWFGPRQVSR